MSRLFERQGWHFATLLLLLLGIYAIRAAPGVLDGQLWGIRTATWLILALAAPIAHQIYTWLMWRTQLETEWVTRRFPHNGFKVYQIIFVLVMLSRVVAIVLLAISNRGTLPISPLMRYGLGLLLTLLFGYLIYSVLRYFSIARAAGGDHFIPAYRDMPLVNKGIYRFTGNAMYTVGFLIVWIPGVVFASKAALIVALFSHIYIWIHYYCTEKPDMDFIYGAKSESTAG
jgi:hypothetical protein